MGAATGGEDARSDLAPVIPLFGAGNPSAEWDTTWTRTPSAGPGRPAAPARTYERAAPERDVNGDADGDDDADADGDDDGGGDVAAAERMLLRKLRARQLSSAEARTALRGAGLAGDAVESLIVRFEERGYLDDRRLADELVHAAHTRKGQGRHAIARTIATRGVARDVADAALAVLPDDDDERALEFARARVQRMGVIGDRDAVLRRLVGQLSRRGYPGPTAMGAARAAMDELRGPRFS